MVTGAFNDLGAEGTFRGTVGIERPMHIDGVS